MLFAASQYAEPAVVELMKTAVLKGLLPALPGSELDATAVNLLNGPLLAHDAGVKVTVKLSGAGAAAGPYANLVRVTMHGKDGSDKVVAGSVIDGEPRVVNIDFWQTFPTFVPQGHVLLYNNLDKPGTISRITAILSESNINIASLLVARQHAGAPALSIVIADARIPTDVANRIAALDGISSVRTASFGDSYATARGNARVEA